ncbi:MAG: hypothetical protein HKO71_00295 [Pseudomonadales bacterium]|nr:hypothetical protein [Pseudomonadales bacterium]
MLTLSAATTFLGWCTLINSGVLVYATVMLFFFRGPAKSIHTRLSGLSAEELDRAYFKFLGDYKLLILVFNLVPYIALKIIAE